MSSNAPTIKVYTEKEKGEGVGCKKTVRGGWGKKPAHSCPGLLVVCSCVRVHVCLVCVH